jgi:hypothetical protein
MNAVFMAIPVTAVNENRSFVFGKNDVKFSGQVFATNSKAKTQAMQD